MSLFKKPENDPKDNNENASSEENKANNTEM